MKILHTVEFYPPSRGGAQEVVRQLSRHLAARGHDVTVATTALPGRRESTLEGVRIEGFKVTGNLARGMTGEVDRYRDFVLGGGFDVVMNYAAQQWATDALLDILPRLKAKKVLVPCGFSGLYQARFARYFESMPGWLEGYDASVFLADKYRDIGFAREHGLAEAKIRFIPNGAGEDEFGPPLEMDIRAALGLRADEFFILSVGTHTGLKGHAESAELVRRSSLKNAALVVVGTRPRGGCARRCRWRAWRSRLDPAMRKRGLRLLDLDLGRAQTVAAYKACDIFLFPSNVECSPLVLFEAAAAGRPFLASNAGNSAEIADWTGGGLVMPGQQDDEGYTQVDIEQGAGMLTMMWQDPALRKRLGHSGRQAWEKTYTWEKLALRYEALYSELLAKG